jgi:hypothetical protein
MKSKQSMFLLAGEAVTAMVNGARLTCFGDEEGDILEAAWSEHCACFHWWYNGERKGIYTGSFSCFAPAPEEMNAAWREKYGLRPKE